MKFHDFRGILGIFAPRRLLAPQVQVAGPRPYYFIHSLFRGEEGRGGVIFPGSPLLRLLSSTEQDKALIQTSRLYGAETL